MNKTTNLNILITFVFGGIVVTLISYISDKVSNLLAALLWAFPFTIIPTLYYLYLQKKDKKHIKDYLLKTIYSIFLLIFIIFIIYYIYLYTSNMFISLLFSIIIYIIISISLYIHFK